MFKTSSNRPAHGAMSAIVAKSVVGFVLLLSRMLLMICRIRSRHTSGECDPEEGQAIGMRSMQRVADAARLLNHGSLREDCDSDTGLSVNGDTELLAISPLLFAPNSSAMERIRAAPTVQEAITKKPARYAPCSLPPATPSSNGVLHIGKGVSCVSQETSHWLNLPQTPPSSDSLSGNEIASNSSTRPKHEYNEHDRLENASLQASPYSRRSMYDQDMSGISPIVKRQREALTPHSVCDDIEFAIICALPVEASAVQSLLQKREGMPKLRKQQGDPIMYTAGYLGQHRVVLAHMGTKGNINACRVAQYCKGSFPGVKFMMVVGICGAVPTNDPDDDPILGDAIVGTAVAQTDFGTYYEDGFAATNRIVDMLGRSSIEVSSKISWLQTDENCEKIRQRAISLVKELQQRGHPSAIYPGTQHDKLYVPTHTHADDSKKCSEICKGDTVKRSRLANGAPEHAIHFGLFGSGNQVIRSAKARDQLLQRLNIKAVEMESAGVWDVCPCIVVKSACDYADSHKMKDFQRYAATTAAATVRAILEFWDE